MHAFTRPSQQLRQKVRDALLQGLHQTSFYRHLMLANKKRGAHTHKVDKAIHNRLCPNIEKVQPSEIPYMASYTTSNSRYGPAPTDECPLYYKPDSCTHIARECPSHKTLTISRHNAACQLIYAPIWKSAKGGAILHSAPDLALLTADTG